MSDKTKANLVLESKRPTALLRLDAIAALEAGADFVLLLPTYGDDCIENLDISTSMRMDDMRECLETAAHDVQFVRPGMNN